MIKDYGIIKAVGAVVSEAAEAVSQRVVRDYSPIRGKEEEITGQLRGEINRYLLTEVSKRLDGRVINGCRFRVGTFTKKQERDVGADLVGVLQIDYAGKRLSKAYLAQSKVGEVRAARGRGVRATTYSPDLLTQVERMLDVSSDSFVFIYTSDGIYCVPALQVKLAGSYAIDTERYPYHTIGSFYEEFTKCFIGDHRIAGAVLGSDNPEEIANAVHANAALLINAKLGAIT